MQCKVRGSRYALKRELKTKRRRDLGTERPGKRKTIDDKR
jgi:hypothetical protein